MNLELKLPPPLVFLLCAAVMKGLPNLLPFYLSTVLSYILIAMGALIALSGIYAFYQAKTTIDPHRIEQTSSLVQTGIYRITRNPMYLGLACWLLAWAVWLANGLALLGVVLFVGYLNRFQIQPEERMMRQKFGEAYSRYQQKVRRWL